MKKIIIPILTLFGLLVLFQNATLNSLTPFRGELSGVGKYPRGYVVWGWACEQKKSRPVSVDIYFENLSKKEKFFWKSTTANQVNEEDKNQIGAYCETSGTYHKFIEHIPFEILKKYSGYEIYAEVSQDGKKLVLPKNPRYTQTLMVDETSAYTKAGWVKGEASKLFANVVSFKGIPYARPPVGPLRWAQSVAPAPWTGEKEAVKFSSACLQEDGHLPADVEKAISRSEDCLYLNVWRPRQVTNAPVYIYIHGGQFKGGWSGLPDYDGTYLASRGIVVVTFNYRVGMMGFFSHPYFKNRRGNMNFGLTDQELVFKWVQANISEFGGDPKNVTISGSSAGGASVGFWMTNKLGIEGNTSTLFHRAIIESGGGSLNHYLENRGQAETRGRQMTTELLTQLSAGKIKNFSLSSLTACAGNDPSHITDECLEQMLFHTPAEVLKQTSYFNRFNNFEFHPFIDGHYVVGGTLDVFKCGLQKNIPLIVGSMGWEADIVEKAIEKNPIKYFYGLNSAQLKSIYGISDNALLAERVYGDRTFAVPARLMAKFHSQISPYTYSYIFNYVGDNMTDEVRTYSKGATHSLLDPFVFNSLSTTGIKDFIKPTVNDVAVAKVWSGYWENFIKGKFDNQGNISSASESAALWEPFRLSDENRLFVNHSGKIKSNGVREFGSKHTAMVSNLLKSRYDFIELRIFPYSGYMCK